MPPKQFRNLLLFLACFLILTNGWNYVKNRLYPPPKPKENVWAYGKRDIREQLEVATRVMQPPSGDGLADLINLATQYLRDPVTGQPIKPVWAYETMKPADRSAMLAKMAAATAGPWSAAVAYLLSPQNVNQFALAGQPVKEVALGGAGFNITATMTARGAGVRELILNPFPGADRNGLEIRDADGKPKAIRLIPRMPGTPPAFAMFHYERAEDDESRPVDTLGETVWTQTQLANDPTADKHEIAYSTEMPDRGIKITKTFTLAKGAYHVGLNIKIERIGVGKAQPFRYQLAGARGLPIEGEWYTTIFRNAFTGLVDNRNTMWRIWEDSATLARYSGGERIRRDDKLLLYTAVGIQYFASAIVVDNLDAAGNPIPIEKRKFLQFARATAEPPPIPARPMLEDITVRAISEAVTAEKDNPVDHQFLLYHGPLKVSQLGSLKMEPPVDPQLVDRYVSTLRLNSLADYGNYGWWTDLIVFFTNVMHKLLAWLYFVLRDYGLCIIALTILVRLAMYPVSRRQAINMQKLQDKMARLKPELAKIEAQHKDDFLGMRQAQAELYRRHNVNPASGLTGCLMVFAQLPIFMGLYFCLQESIFFRLERFLWMPNLAAPDMFLRWGEGIPVISTPDSQGGFLYLGPYLNLLPIIGAVLMFIQQKMTMPPPADEQQAVQQSMMKYMLILFAVMFYKVPAGLSLYFIISSGWGVLERKLLPKSQPAGAGTPPPPGGTSPPNGSPAKPSPNKPRGKPAKEIKPPVGKWRAMWDKILEEAKKK